MTENPFNISSESKASIENEVLQELDNLLQQIDDYIAGHDLDDTIDNETSRPEERLIRNCADYEIDDFAECIQSEFQAGKATTLNMSTIALLRLGLQLKRKRITDPSD